MYAEIMNIRSGDTVLKALATIFLALGFISIVGVIGHWHFDHTIPWLFVGYAAMNILLGIGFWRRERWLLAAIALNGIAYGVLYIGAWLWGADIAIENVVVSSAVAGGVWWLVYLHQRHLGGTASTLAGTSFFLIWILTYGYMLATII